MNRKNTLLELNPKDISEEKGLNTRYDLGDLRELKQSMENKGFDPSEPLIVRPDPDNEGAYILGSQGHRRLTAANEVGLKVVYAILEPADLSASDRNLDIVRLNSGEPLPMLAVARVVGRVKEGDAAIEHKDIAKLIGKSPMFISSCVKLLKTTPKTQKRIEQDRISASQVIAIFDEEEGDAEKTEIIVEKMIESAKDTNKTKATKKDKAKTKDDGEEETEAERKAREEEEAEAKALKKLLKQTRDRAVKFYNNAKELLVKNRAEGGGVSAHEMALSELTLLMGAFICGQILDTRLEEADKGDQVSASMVAGAYKNVLKTHKEMVKETAAEVKEIVTEKANEKVQALQEKVEETKEAAKERIAKAKAAAAKK